MSWCLEKEKAAGRTAPTATPSFQRTPSYHPTTSSSRARQSTSSSLSQSGDVTALGGLLWYALSHRLPRPEHEFVWRLVDRWTRELVAWRYCRGAS